MNWLRLLVVHLGLAPYAVGQVVLDQVAATVEDEIITLSDVYWSLAYRSIPIPEDPEARERLFQEILSQLINQRLISRETAKTPFIRVTASEVDQFFDSYSQRFESEEAFSQRLKEMRMTESDLRRLLSYQLSVNKFVELRFEPFIIVLPKAIETYYDEEFVPELERGGQPIPSLEVVEETIRQILSVQRTTEQLEAWVENSLQTARVQRLLNTPNSALPNLPSTFWDSINFQPVDLNRKPSSSPQSESPDRH